MGLAILIMAAAIGLGGMLALTIVPLAGTGDVVDLAREWAARLALVGAVAVFAGHLYRLIDDLHTVHGLGAGSLGGPSEADVLTNGIPNVLYEPGILLALAMLVLAVGRR